MSPKIKTMKTKIVFQGDSFRVFLFVMSFFVQKILILFAHREKKTPQPLALSCELKGDVDQLTLNVSPKGLQGELEAAHIEDEGVRKRLKILEDEKDRIRQKHFEDEESYSKKYGEFLQFLDSK